MAKFKVTETLQSWYRGKTDGPHEIQWLKEGNALDVMHAVASILQMDADQRKESKRFPHLQTECLGIKIELITEEEVKEN